MAEPFVIRRGWMKVMYIYTIVGAGGFGLGIIAAPGVMRTALGWPGDEPLALGIAGSVYVAFAVLSAFGLRDPLRFTPVLLLQLCYKSIWFAGVVLPLAVRGHFPAYGLFMAAVFATYIVGDLIAIPFRYLFARAAGPYQGAAPRGAA